MSEAGQIRRNSLFSFLSTGIRLGANMLMFVGVARFFGPEAFGQFTLAFAYLSLFFLVADFGFDILLATEVARDKARARELVRRLLPLKGVSSVVATIGMIATAYVAEISPATKLMMYVLSIGVAGNALASFFYALCRGHEALQYETNASFVQNAFLLLALLILGILGAPLLTVAGAYVASRLLALVFIVMQVKNRFHIRFLDISLENCWSTLRESIPFGLFFIFGTLFFQIDTLLLAHWSDDHSVGMYQAAMKLIILVLMISDVIVGVFLPVLSRLHAEDKERWLRINRLLGKTLSYVGIPFGVILFLFAEQVIHLIYGTNGFEEAVPVLRIFSCLLVVRFLAEVYAMMLTTGRKQSTRTYIVVAATLLNVILNSVFIPRYGIVGAALVSLITNIAAGISYVLAAQILLMNWSNFLDWRLGTVLGLTVLFTFTLSILNIGSVFWGLLLIGGFFFGTYYFVGYSREERLLAFSWPS